MIFMWLRNKIFFSIVDVSGSWIFYFVYFVILVVDYKCERRKNDRFWYIKVIEYIFLK